MAKPDRKYQVFEIDTDDIFYDWEFNCRDQFTLESVKDLADTIKQEGLHFPLVIQPRGDGDKLKWRLICGHRRFKAVTAHLGWKKVPAMIRDDLTEQEARMLNLRENLERKDLNILEEAKAIQGIFPDGVSLRAGARAFKRSERWVQSRLRLLKLPEEVQKMAAAGLVSALDVDILVKMDTPQEQISAARERAKYEMKKAGGRRTRKPKRFQRAFQYKRSKAEVNKMIELLWWHRIEGLAPRLLAWANGYVPDDEIKQEIKDASQRGTSKDDRHNSPEEGDDDCPDLQ